MKKTIHMCVDVSGVLRWKDRELGKMFADESGPKDGRMVRDWLKLQLAKGIEVLPMGEKCEGWSDVTGCPGHEVSEEEEA